MGQYQYLRTLLFCNACKQITFFVGFLLKSCEFEL